MIKPLLIFGLLAFVGLISNVTGQYTKYRVCATLEFATQCTILQRGNSDVTCTYVQDAIECAQHIRNGSSTTTAQFGLFSAESALQLAVLRWDDLVVIKESRHKERPNEVFEYQSVVVVKDPHFSGGLDNLRNKNYCHPGFHYSRSQKWSERFLKAFERVTVDPKCDVVRNASVAEIETASLSQYFNAACRGGVWSHDEQEDAYLKKTYTNLCSLCDDPLKCEYSTSVSGSDHRRALECVKKNGNVAYVSLAESLAFFRDNLATASEYKYLCQNGTVQAVNTTTPCTWEKQPWPVVMTNSNKSVELKSLLTTWANGRQEWQVAVTEILTDKGNHALLDTTIQVVRNSFGNSRFIPNSDQICNKQINWCTRSPEETEKCKVAQAGALTAGAYPPIDCKEGYPANSVIQCLHEISLGKSDIMHIDSNYGFIARNNFNLTSALYDETNDQQYSKVVILIKSNSRISKFNDLKGKKACFPEFGGIASVAFVDVGRGRGLFKQNECNYGRLLADFFGDTCAPGAKNVLHDQIFVKKSSSEADKLCSLCRNQASEQRFPMEDNIETLSAAGKNPNVRGQLKDDAENVVESRPKRQTSNHCTPSSENRYFGTRGALQCLHEVGDVAVLELRKLKQFSEELKLDPQDYKIMCRNGTIVPTNNFEVDQNCPLVTMIDGEVVIKRRSEKTKDVVHALKSFDRYFNIIRSPDFQIFKKFNGKEDLLFEDSTVGFVSANATEFGPSVLNYIRLFENTDKCVEKKNSGTLATISSFVMVISVLVSMIMQ